MHHGMEVEPVTSRDESPWQKSVSKLKFIHKKRGIDNHAGYDILLGALAHALVRQNLVSR
jgi:hypothetical protein